MSTGLLARMSASGAVSPPPGISVGLVQEVPEPARVEVGDEEVVGPSPAVALATEFSREVADALPAVEAIIAGANRVCILPEGADTSFAVAPSDQEQCG